MKGSFFVSEREAPVPKAYLELWIGADPETVRLAKILSSTISGGRPLLSTDLAGDRTAAEGLTGELVWVERARVEALESARAQELDDSGEDEGLDDEDGLAASEGDDEGEEGVDEDELLFWGDLPGLIVVDAQGVALGKITDVYNTGASDVITVTGDDGGELDLALVETYVDFDAGIDDGKLHLVVDASVFADLWQR